ncbi:MAG: hypothetical protein GC162_04110 [Planctomycetes bacterium]|nr:hypothetical protein [Planctomycetota bacterium]
MSDEQMQKLLDQIEADLFAGRKIQAIKIYREHTGVGLKEAKEEVEKIEAGLRATSPEKFAKAPGCAAMIALMILSGAALWGVLH